jgi:hypothetical protein
MKTILDVFCDVLIVGAIVASMWLAWPEKNRKAKS